MNDIRYTIPGISLSDGQRLVEILQERLHAMNDLQLTLKHVHWNVVGRNFIGVHEMIDPQVETVRGFADDIAERIAALGGSPVGTPGRIASDRTWSDYNLGRASTAEHLAALNLVYDGVITDNRKAVTLTGEIDPMTEDLLTGQTRDLEQFQWFVRAHLEDDAGALASAGASSEQDAAKKVSNQA